MSWFGESWGAPVCSETPHVPTPVGERCLDCGEPIGEADQGVIQPYAERANGEWSATLKPRHLDCFLQTVLPHSPDCEHCRGLERGSHKMSCSYRKHGGNCDCPFGEAARRFRTGAVSVAQAAEDMGMTAKALLERVDLWLMAPSFRNRPHNSGNDPGKRKA